MKPFTVLSISAFVIVVGVNVVLTASATAEVREYYKCKLNEGATIEQVAQIATDLRPISEKAGFGDYHPALLIPMYSSDISAGAFYWMGSAPNMARLGAGSDWFGQSEDTDAIRKRFEDILDCESASVYHVIPLE
ncbi:MAG: hypothetical protein ACE5EM_12800 [Sphingomonadales bacterium]